MTENTTPEDAGRTPTSRMAQRLMEKRQSADEGTNPTETASTAESQQHLQAFVFEELPKDVQDGVSKPVKESAPLKAPTPIKATGRRLRRLLDDDIDTEIEEAMGDFDQQSLLEQPAAPKNAPEGDEKKEVDPNKRTVRVLDVRGEYVFVDLGEKSEGIVPTLQFGGKVPAAGEIIDLIVDRFHEADGVYILRRPGEAQEADWGNIDKGMVVDAAVKKQNKGGLEVTVSGIRGFMPAGQVDADHIADLSIFVGQTLRCIVTEANRSDRNLVVSRKAIQLKERAEKAETTLAALKVGDICPGTVKRLTDFGAFIDLGGVDGLLHVSQMSWQKVRHPSEHLFQGQEVKVVILNFDKETKKIGLGLRQLVESPWTKAAIELRPGSTASGKVTRLADFGAFVELMPGVEGLIHISELSHTRVRRVSEVVKEGQEVDVQILDFDMEKQRISLSLKALSIDPKVAEEEAAEAKAEAEAAAWAARKKPNSPLKGGLGGPAGPLFG